MSTNSTIEWTDATWNPTRGCSVVSEGCRRCYAKNIAARFSGPGLAYEGLAYRVGTDARWTGVVRYIPEQLETPLRWRKPRNIFVDSMSDLFHEKIPDDVIDRIYGVMALCGALGKGHVFQALTKRPERALEYFGAAGLDLDEEATALDGWNWRAEVWAQRLGAAITVAIGPEEGRLVADSILGLNADHRLNVGWPLKNVWLGVSAEDQATWNTRVEQALWLPSAVPWVSLEPLIGVVDPYPMDAFDRSDVEWPGRLGWLVTGGESMPGCRPCETDWLRAIQDFCKRWEIPFFLKQLGGHPDKRGHDKAVLDGRRYLETPARWPDYLNRRNART